MTCPEPPPAPGRCFRSAGCAAAARRPRAPGRGAPGPGESTPPGPRGARASVARGGHGLRLDRLGERGTVRAHLPAVRLLPDPELDERRARPGVAPRHDRLALRRAT